MAKQKRYQAVCLVCYSCHIGAPTNSKRAAWTTAGNHAGAYHHDCDVHDYVAEAERMAEREAQRQGEVSDA